MQTPNYLIVGASYVVRWSHSNAGREKFGSALNAAFVGFGGAPAWDAELFRRATAAPRTRRTLLILGDVRFGNTIGARGNDMNDTVFVANHRMIDRDYIDPAIDLALQRRTRRALIEWRRHFREALEIVPWALLMRPVERALHGGSEPRSNACRLNDELWNLGTIQDPAYAPVVDFQGIADAQRDLQHFIIDSNLHPSPLGYFFLEKILEGMTPPEAIGAAKLDCSNALVADISRSEKPTLICGNSRALSRLVSSLGTEGTARLDEKGIFVRCDNSAMLAAIIRKNAIARTLFIADDTASDPDQFALQSSSRIALLRAKGARLRNADFLTVPWVLISRDLISRRHETLAHHRLMTGEQAIVEDFRRLDSKRHGNLVSDDLCIDIGEELEPTLLGLRRLLELA